MQRFFLLSKQDIHFRLLTRKLIDIKIFLTDKSFRMTIIAKININCVFTRFGYA